MRVCNLCNRALRYDENFTLTRVESTDSVQGTLGGGVFVASALSVPTCNSYACPDCCARETGLSAPEPRYYLAGKRVPPHPERPNSDMPVCGLCRQALYEDDNPKLLRLREEELDEHDRARGIKTQDAFMCCRECIAKYQPRKLDYLKRMCRMCHTYDCRESGHNAILPETATLRQVVGGMLT